MNIGQIAYLTNKGSGGSQENSEYAIKRENIASLLSKKELDDEFRQLERMLCCCPDENILNCGCVAHGLKTSHIVGKKSGSFL